MKSAPEDHYLLRQPCLHCNANSVLHRHGQFFKTRTSWHKLVCSWEKWKITQIPGWILLHLSGGIKCRSRFLQSIVLFWSVIRASYSRGTYCSQVIINQASLCYFSTLMEYDYCSVHWHAILHGKNEINCGKLVPGVLITIVTFPLEKLSFSI